MTTEVHHILFDLNAVDEASVIAKAAEGLVASNTAVERALLATPPPQATRVITGEPSFQRALRGAVLGRMGAIRSRVRHSVVYRPLQATRARPVDVSVKGTSLFEDVPLKVPKTPQLRWKNISFLQEQQGLDARLLPRARTPPSTIKSEGPRSTPSKASRHAEMIKHLETLEASKPAPDLQKLGRTDPSRPGMQDPERFRGVIPGTGVPVWDSMPKPPPERLPPTSPTEPVELNFLDELRNAGVWW